MLIMHHRFLLQFLCVIHLEPDKYLEKIMNIMLSELYERIKYEIWHLEKNERKQKKGKGKEVTMNDNT